MEAPLNRDKSKQTNKNTKKKPNSHIDHDGGDCTTKKENTGGTIVEEETRFYVRLLKDSAALRHMLTVVSFAPLI